MSKHLPIIDGLVARAGAPRPVGQRAADAPKAKIVAAGDETVLYLYDAIDEFWGISANELVKEIDAIKTAKISVRINSPGGDVFGAAAIYNALVRHSAQVTTHVDALAASAASVIALAGDSVRMSGNAFFMIHDPWTLMMGNAGELRGMADLLDKIAGSIRGVYAKKTGLDDAELSRLMQLETWYDAAEAKAAGFVDAVEGEDAGEAFVDRFNLSAFRRVPGRLAANAVRAQPAPAPADLSGLGIESKRADLARRRARV